MIESELNPNLLSKNKTKITQMITEFRIDKILIFSMMYFDKNSVLDDKFKKYLENYFDIEINGLVEIEYLRDCHLNSKYSREPLNKTTYFKIYCDMVNSENVSKIVLLDDTTPDANYSINGIICSTVRG